MNRKGAWFLCAVACLSMTPPKLLAQGCGVVMVKHYSSYETASSDGTHIYTAVVVDGYADCSPTIECPCNTAIHTPKAYNHIGTVGGWASGSGTCPTCYLSYGNNQSTAATPGVVYYFNGEGQIICSIAGTFFDDLFPQQPEKVPSISGPSSLWWFKGLSLGVSGYSNQITLTATAGGSSYSWAIASGNDKVSLSSSATNQVQVTSIGQSATKNDVSITVTMNGLQSSPFKLTVYAPYALGADPSQPTPVYSHDSIYVWDTDIYYQVRDNFLSPLPTAVPVNENWTTAVIADYTNENWRQGAAGCDNTDSSALFYDHIGGEEPARYPKPVYRTPYSGPAVYHWGQEWRVGTCVNGSGPRVQTDTLQKYTDHAAHNGITSPAP